MHEMSICEGIVQIIEEQAALQHYTQVKVVNLEIGSLAGVEIESIKFCFDVVCRDSIAEGSILKIKETPGTAWCMQCAQSHAVSERYSACPTCGSYQMQVTGGDQLKIKELEVA